MSGNLSRGGLAVKLGPGRFGSKGARDNGSEILRGTPLEKFSQIPRLASNDIELTSNNLNGFLK